MNNAEQKAFFRQCLYTALLELMKEQGFDKISVGALCERAGVSRMTYYRSYRSKEDILLQHLDESFARYFDALQSGPEWELRSAAQAFFHVISHTEREFYLCIVRQKLSSLLMDRFYVYLSRMLALLLPEQTWHPYIRSYLTGGLYKVTVDWIENGMDLSEEQMTALLVELVELTGRFGQMH